MIKKILNVALFGIIMIKGSICNLVLNNHPYEGNWYFVDTAMHSYSELYITDSTVTFCNDIIEVYGTFNILCEDKNCNFFTPDSGGSLNYLYDNYPASLDSANLYFGGTGYLLLRIKEEITIFKPHMKKKQYCRFYSDFIERSIKVLNTEVETLPY